MLPNIADTTAARGSPAGIWIPGGRLRPPLAAWAERTVHREAAISGRMPHPRSYQSVSETVRRTIGLKHYLHDPAFRAASKRHPPSAQVAVE
jgi:hypothetical protein